MASTVCNKIGDRFCALIKAVTNTIVEVSVKAYCGFKMASDLVLSVCYAQMISLVSGVPTMVIGSSVKFPRNFLERVLALLLGRHWKSASVKQIKHNI